jgi:putative endonuclease
MERRYWVYLLANRRQGTLYVGATSDLPGRVFQHKTGVIDGFR